MPLLHLRAILRVRDRIRLLLDADALAAPQGRAEDLLAAAEWDASRALALRAGHRLLEGGADNDQVHTFARLNYLVAGATVRL